MRIVLTILILLHGIIHLTGFAKAYNLAKISSLQEPIPKSSGTLWLTGGIFLFVSAILFFLRKDYFWFVATPAVVISQVLIFSYWQDAKFGSIANFIIGILALISLFTYRFERKFESNVHENLSQHYFDSAILSENDISPLPEPVKKYLRYTQSVGKPKVNNFRITFAGQLRQNEKSPWMPFSSVQYNFMEHPTRLFFMKAIMKNLPVNGYHYYLNGTAVMDIRLLSMFKVQYMEGKEMNESETVTFFNDMCCLAPATLIDQRIKWFSSDSLKVAAEFTVKNITVHAQLYFNEKGELINFISNDRYSADAGKKLPWSTPLKEYQEVNGYRLAGYAEAIYKYPRGEIVYGTFRTKEIEYNCSAEH